MRHAGCGRVETADAGCGTRTSRPFYQGPHQKDSLLDRPTWNKRSARRGHQHPVLAPRSSSWRTTRATSVPEATEAFCSAKSECGPCRIFGRGGLPRLRPVTFLWSKLREGYYLSCFKTRCSGLHLPHPRWQGGHCPWQPGAITTAAVMPQDKLSLE